MVKEDLLESVPNPAHKRSPLYALTEHGRQIFAELGALRPNSWTLFIFGIIVSVAIGIALTWWIPRLYPWGSERPQSI